MCGRDHIRRGRELHLDGFKPFTKHPAIEEQREISAFFPRPRRPHHPSPAQACGARVNGKCYILRYRVPLPAPSLATRPRDARAFRMRVVLSLLKPLRSPISARVIRMLRLISSMSLRSSRVIPSGRAASKRCRQPRSECRQITQHRVSSASGKKLGQLQILFRNSAR